MESDLSAHILADPAIAGLIGTRMYPLTLPQGVTYPAVSYYLVSADELRDLSGAIGEEQARITFNSWAETYLKAKQVAKAINARINGLKATIGGTCFSSVRKETERDAHEEGGAAGVYGVTMDFMVAHRNVS